MKVDRKTKPQTSPPKAKAAKTARRVTAKSNGKHPLAAYEHIPIGIVEASLQGKYMDVNEEFCRILGYSRQELLRLGIKDCTPEDDYAIDGKLHEQLIAGKVPFYRLEKRFLRKGGGEIWVELTRSLVRGPRGKPLYTIGVVLDISERKDVERVLRDSAERLRLATGAAQMFMWEWDFQNQNYTLADNFEHVLGFSGGLLPRNNFDTLWALSPREDLQRISEGFEEAVAHQNDLHALPYRVINPENGQIVWLEISAKIIYDHEGKPERMFGVAQNVTESRKIQDEIAIISRMPEENPNPVMRLMPDGNVLYANGPSRQLLEVWKQQIDQPIPDELKQRVARAFDSDLKQEIEIEQSGKIFSFTLAPIGEAGYVNLYGIDITERKRIEEALRIENERFMRFVDSNIVGILIGNARGEVILANDYYLSLLGVSRQDLLEQKVDWKKFTPPEWLPADEKVIRELRESGVCEPYEKEYVRTDGTRIPVYITNAMLPGPGEEIAAFVLDITERKRAEEVMRRNEKMFSTLVDAAPFGVYFIDSEFRLRGINKGSEAVFSGIQPLIGRDFAEVLRVVWQEPFASETIERFRHTLRTGESFLSPPVIEPRANVEEIQAYDWQIHRITLPDGTFGVVCYFYDLSEQKQMEATMRASEALYRAIARSIPGGGVYVVDKNLRYLVAEGPVTEAFGLTREMLEGHTVSEVFPGDRGERMADRLKRTFAGESLDFETNHNGRVFWTQQAPLLDSIGQAIIVTMDITERKQAEEALRQSEERFARFMHRLPGLAWIKDLEGHYVYANAAAEQAFHTPREKLLGSTDDDIFPPEAAAQFKRNDEQALTDEKGVQLIETLKHADGVLHYSLVSKFPIPGPDGSTVLIGGTAFDITERLRAEEALRESEERFRAILRQATAGIARKDAEGRLLFVNQAFCNMLGYTESDLTDRTVWEFIHPDDVAENKRSYDRLMLEGIPFKLERRLLRQDGSILWVDASVSPIMDATGKPQSAVTVEVDITARKQAEDALQQLNLQLEERVLTRTAKLRSVNQALREEVAERQKAEAAARANEEKLSTLFELLPVGISFLDLDGRIIQMNTALANILKLPKEHFFDKQYKPRKYIRPNGAPMTPTEFASRRALTEGKTIYNVETGVVVEDGEVIWTSVSAAPVAVADVGAVVVTADITESKRAEKALQESRERLRILSQRLVEVQEEERRSIARELHDRVGQTLAALNINLIIINGQLSPESLEQVGARLGDSMKLVAETISLVRDVMSNLRPSVLDDYGLEAAVESHLSQFTSRYEIGVKFKKPAQPIPRLGSSIEMTFLRIAQEALINIARHAQATQVDLELSQEDNAICMTVQDNGTGITSWQDANRPGSHGLTIMRERAEAFGGNLKISSVPGKGTKVEVRIPFETNNPPQAQKEKSQ